MPTGKHVHIDPLVIPSGFMTLQQAAKALGLSYTTVMKLVNDGKLAESKVPGIHKRRLIKRTVLERYARNNGLIVLLPTEIQP